MDRGELIFIPLISTPFPRVFRALYIFDSKKYCFFTFRLLIVRTGSLSLYNP